jgi:hypothetical protein
MIRDLPGRHSNKVIMAVLLPRRPSFARMIDLIRFFEVITKCIHIM